MLPAAGLAKRIKKDAIPDGRRVPVDSCGELQNSAKDTVQTQPKAVNSPP